MKIMRFIMVLLLCCAIFLVYVYIDNNTVDVTEYDLEFINLPEAFDGYKIVQLTDYHGNELRFHDNAYIAEKISEMDPDIIVITGDVIDRLQMDLTEAFDFLEKIAAITDVYYVDGNHEKVNYDNYGLLVDKIEELGIVYLREDIAEISKGDASIYITGVVTTANTSRFYNDTGYIEALNEIDGFKIMLSHLPHIDYSMLDVDLIYSGHTHGGLIQLPFIGGIIAPGQWLNPEFDKGVFQLEDGKTMVISSGLSNSMRIPVPRIFNSPEIVVTTLKSTGDGI